MRCCRIPSRRRCSAVCGLRFGRNPCEHARESCSNTAPSTHATAFWTARSSIVLKIASYCLSCRYSPEFSSQMLRVGNALAACCLNFRGERDAQATGCGAACRQMAALDPVIDRIGTDAQTRGDLIDAQFSGLETRRGWHPVDVADPFDGRYVEWTACARLMPRAVSCATSS